MTIRFAKVVFLLAVMSAVGQSCEYGSTDASITFVNETNHVVRVSEDGVEFVTLRPGQQRAFSFTKSSMPSRIQAYSNGELIHDGTLVWSEVEANGFTYVIDETKEPSPTPTPLTALPMIQSGLEL